jgi:hypothetical protein
MANQATSLERREATSIPIEARGRGVGESQR